MLTSSSVWKRRASISWPPTCPNRLRVGIMAMVADEGRRTISARTKAALAAAKKRGTKLGGYREGAKLTRATRQAGRPRNKSASRVTNQFQCLGAFGGR